MKNTLFPVFLKTEALRFLIVGGGKVGLEKTETLLRQNPHIAITLVAPQILAALKNKSAQYPHIKFIERPFEVDDVNDADFVIIATNITAVNKQVKFWANSKGKLVNAADQPSLCDFYLGSIVNKGSMKIAISTNGKSPVLARRMREYLEDAIPDSIDETIELLHEFRTGHKGSLKAKLADLNKVTAGLSLKSNKKEAKYYKRRVAQISLLFMVLFTGYGLAAIVSAAALKDHISSIPNEFYGMLLVGFFAQLVDGALGLGYGITCATSMMLLGVKLPAISGSIHTAEMFSSGISGYTHYKFGNVNKKLLVWLAIPGVIGAISGAAALIYLGKKYEAFAYAVLSLYTMIIGIRLLLLAYRKKQERSALKRVGLLGFFGGFLDSFGGGGWGPIVTSTLLAKGKKTNFVVGTVSLAEFFVTLAAAMVFFISLGVTHWYVVLGLILGGAVAAPLAAKLSGRLPKKTALILVALLVIIFSVRVFIKIM
jgi:siroheme synthase-like protein